MCQYSNLAHGTATVCSTERPECHAPSGYSVKDYSGKPAANGIAPRDRQRAVILAFWEEQGIARYNRRAGGVWEVRDMVNGGDAWLPIAGQADAGRADRAEFSHIRACANGGAWCACNVLPENGATNAARGDRDVTDLTMSARAVLAAWPAWFRANVARKASLARLSA